MKTKTACFVCLAFLLCSCQEKQLEPINLSKGKPAQVRDVLPERIPGGAVISFVIPQDADVLSVKAVYTLTNGKERESIVSFYGNSLTVEGYNDTLEHEALLYTVSRAQVLSDPLSVKFTPLESPLSKTIKSIDIISDFGGAYFTWKNKDKVMLTAEMLSEDANGKLHTVRIVSSSLDSAYFSIRGYDPKPQKFGLIIGDNWDNVSDTIYPEGGWLTPKEESQLDKKLFSIYKVNNNYITGDATFVNWEGRDEYMFDDDVATYGHSYTGSLPVNITLDLGKAAQLSRVVFFQRYIPSDPIPYYGWGNPRHIIVYGRLDAPPSSGSFTDWTELIDFTMIKPSGTNSDYTVCTDEDLQAAQIGHEASFPMSENAWRYLRFHFATSWENRPYVHPAEITLYGEYAE
ncbi:MAG: DUF4959 domain-containing protein [Bacteroidales bacterium]|nr:DUF4959 domain-containing protein [Bacteroidales bacterium]